MENEIQAETQSEIKTTKCLNCSTEFVGNYCPECGQSAETGKFTFKFIWENLIAAIRSPPKTPDDRFIRPSNDSI